MPGLDARLDRPGLARNHTAAPMTVDPMTVSDIPAARPLAAAVLAPLRAPYAPPDDDLAAQFFKAAAGAPEAESRIDACAARLVAAIHARTGGVGGIKDFLHEYS